MASGNNFKNTIANSLRNTSCSHGWLNKLNHFLFGAITVVLFALLMLTVLNEAIADGRDPAVTSATCLVTKCAVVCSHMYLGEADDQLAFALTETGDFCKKRGISLTLNNPRFQDGNLPVPWMVGYDFNITSLDITGGNLDNIPPAAFTSLSFKYLRYLTFQAVTIKKFIPETLLGLYHLTELHIRSSIVGDIHENALGLVKEKLRTLYIKECNLLNPKNFTGTLGLNDLTVVDMSLNNFGYTLDRKSFKGLSSCRLLFLRSSGISAIGEGAFDHLTNLSHIKLNDNFLKTLPINIFERIISLNTDFDIRIDLQDNPWHCDCMLEDVKKLYKLNILIGDPVCESPYEYKNQHFSSIVTLCQDFNDSTLIASSSTEEGSTKSITSESTEVTSTPYIYTENSNITSTESIDILTTSSPEYAQVVGSDYVNTLCRDSEANQNVSLKCEDINITTSGYTYFLYDLISISNKSQLLNKLELTFDLLWEHLEIKTEAVNYQHYDIIWFQTLCPKEIFCFKTHFAQLLSTDNHLSVYCAVEKSEKIIKAENCVTYMASFDYQMESKSVQTVWTIASIGLVLILTCVAVTAFLVLVAVRKNPSLLRGSKRVLLVRHRVADALILPPEFPIETKLHSRDSMRSIVSGTPSYISALQPTEDQLISWRLNRLPYISDHHMAISCNEKLPYAEQYGCDIEKGENHI